MQLGPILGIIAVIVVVAIWWYVRREIGTAYIDALSEQRKKKKQEAFGPILKSGPPEPEPESEPDVKREGKNLFPDDSEAKASGGDTSGPTAAPPSPSPTGTPTIVPLAGPPGSGESTSDRKPVPSPKPIQSEAAPATPATSGGDTPVAATEDVRFTAFHPKEAAVETWYTLLVYSHVESAAGKVQDDAQRFKQDMGSSPRSAGSTSPAKLVRGTEIAVVPEVEGVEFNPPRISFKWVEDMQRAEFRMRAGKALAGSAANGVVSIFVGPLIVATIKISMLFDDAASVPVTQIADTQATARIYKQEEIFVSYSHADSPVVIACRDAYLALGYDVLIDIDKLRSGEHWNQALMDLIDRADIFQLFWSQNSSKSVYVHQEWEYALKKSATKGEGFIRPVYWEKPLIAPPPELEPLHFAYVPLSKPTPP